MNVMTFFTPCFCYDPNIPRYVCPTSTSKNKNWFQIAVIFLSKPLSELTVASCHLFIKVNSLTKHYYNVYLHGYLVVCSVLRLRFIFIIKQTACSTPMADPVFSDFLTLQGASITASIFKKPGEQFLF